MISRAASEAQDARRAELDDLSIFHLVLTASLFPETPPALLRLSMSDLESELIVRTMRMRAERQRLEKEIARQKARKKIRLASLLTEGRSIERPYKP